MTTVWLPWPLPSEAIKVMVCSPPWETLGRQVNVPVPSPLFLNVAPSGRPEAVSVTASPRGSVARTVKVINSFRPTVLSSIGSTTGGGLLEKVAVTTVFCSIAKVSGFSAPVRSPDQPVKK